MTEPSREILPRADGVRAFTGPAFAGIADCAPSGRVRLDALARWLQDVAYADVLDAGLESVAVWVVRRTRIRVNRWPQFAERFAVTTFCSGLGRMWAERRTDVTRPGAGAPDVEAVSLWVHLDAERRLPFPLTEAEVTAYSGAEPQRRVTRAAAPSAAARDDAGRRRVDVSRHRVRPRRPHQQRRLLAAARRGIAAARVSARAGRHRNRISGTRSARRQTVGC